jgi:hypothetical protein
LCRADSNENEGARLLWIAIQTFDYPGDSTARKPLQEGYSLEPVDIANPANACTYLHRIGVPLVIRFCLELDLMPYLEWFFGYVVPEPSDLEHEVAPVGFRIERIHDREAVTGELCLSLSKECEIREVEIGAEPKMPLVFLENPAGSEAGRRRMRAISTP